MCILAAVLVLFALRAGETSAPETASQPADGHETPPTDTDQFSVADSFVGTWKCADGMIEMEFRLGNWDENDRKDPEGSSLAFLCVWAGPPDAEGKRLVQSAGFVVWEISDRGIVFEGVVGKGAGALLDDGKNLSLSWESLKADAPFYSRQTEEHQALLRRQ